MLVLTGLHTVAAIDGWIERTIYDINAHGDAATQNYGDSDEESIGYVSSIDLIDLSDDDE